MRAKENLYELSFELILDPSDINLYSELKGIVTDFLFITVYF